MITLLSEENGWGIGNKLELAMIILSGLATITSYVYTIWTVWRYKHNANKLKFSKTKDKVKSEIATFFGIYSSIEKTDKYKLLLNSLNNAMVNFTRQAKKTYPRKHEELLEDIEKFADDWHEFAKYLMTNTVIYKDLSHSGKRFISDSINYIDVMDADDYDGHELLQQITFELNDLINQNNSSIETK